MALTNTDAHAESYPCHSVNVTSYFYFHLYPMDITLYINRILIFSLSCVHKSDTVQTPRSYPMNIKMFHSRLCTRAIPFKRLALTSRTLLSPQSCPHKSDIGKASRSLRHHASRCMRYLFTPLLGGIQGQTHFQFVSPSCVGGGDLGYIASFLRR